MEASHAKAIAAPSPRRFVLASLAFTSAATLAVAVLVRGLPGWISEATTLPPLLAIAVISSGTGAALIFVGVAGFIAARRRHSVFALFIALTLLLRAVSLVSDLTALGRDSDWSAPAALVKALYAALVVLLLYVFPDGRFVPRWLAWVWAAWSIWLFATLTSPSANPVLSEEISWVAPVLVTMAASGFAAQVYRYRAIASREQQLQTKWITYGLSFYFAEFAAAKLLPLVIPQFADERAPAGVTFAALANTAEAVAASLVAVTLAFAILRRRLLEIDVVVNRTLVWVSTTAVVTGLFALVSTLTQRTLVEMTGQHSAAADVVVALLVGALFGPVKSYIQSRVDRRLR